VIGVAAPELRPLRPPPRSAPPLPVPPGRRRRSRNLPALAFWLLAIAAGAAAVTLRDPRIALAGTALVVPVAPWLGLREYAAWALNAAVLGVAFTDGIWIAMAVATVAVLVVPGLLLLEAATVPRHDVLRSPAYLPAASLVVLAVVGVSANFAAPRFDAVEPFTTYPMLIALDVALVLFALLAALRRPQPPLPTAALLHAWPRVRDGWPLLLPAAAAVGASALGSSGDRTITVAVLASAVATLAVGLFLAGRRAPVRAALALYGAALACVYSFTLPGSEVFGWDITGEYATLTAVLEHGSWARLHEHDAYGAMLSLTVVPAALHALAGLAPVVILKAVYPALLALFPVLVFTIGCRIVAPRAAYLAALAIVAQAAFIQQLPAIARQEAALLEFGALLAVLADRELRPGTRRTLVAVFGTGVVVSHYSTAYMTIALLALGVVAGLALALVRRGVRLLPRAAFALVVVVVAAATWYGPVTGSYSNAGDALQSIAADGLNVLPGASGKGPLDAYLRGNVVRNISAPTYEREVAARYAQSRPGVVPLPAGRDPRYALRDDPVPQTGDAAARRGLSSAVTIVLQLVNLLAIAGALTLALRRRASPTARLFGALGVGALAILAVARISGTIAATYNLERLEVQMLAVTGIGLALLLQRLARWHVTGRILTGLFALGLLVAVAAGTGLGAVATGAGGPANLSRSGEDAERFTITPAERAAAQWLGGHAPPGAQIYADRYAQLRLFAFAQRGSSFLTAVTPRTLDQNAVVYASRANWVDGRARDAVGADLATYAFPRAYLDAHYDRPYVSQQGAVYSR
jgi:uncharacterized membrane protein